MLTLLHSQLENEKKLFEKLASAGRKDLLAEMILKRVAREIVEIDKRIKDHECATREKDSKRGFAHRFIQHVFEIVYRFGRHKDGGSRKILAIFTGAEVQAQGGRQ